jgi:pimeloyl-ACP methyl ester carboxylesterase
METVTVPAGELDYYETGSGPPVVLLHGVLMDHTVWDRVLPLLPPGFRYLRPVLPLGAHRRPMHPDADLTLPGQVALVADLLDALDLEDVTLVHSDWGGALFLTAHGRDQRVARQVILPCEAFDNFPPGLPGKILALRATPRFPARTCSRCSTSRRRSPAKWVSSCSPPCPARPPTDTRRSRPDRTRGLWDGSHLPRATAESPGGTRR